MKNKPLLLFMLLLIFPNCTYSKKQETKGSEIPAWVHDPHRAYPQSMYLVGVGSGATRADAENSAVGAIAKIFQSKVTVDETLVEQYLESKDQFSFASQMLKNTSVGSDQELKNITMAKSFFDETEGMYYVLAYLDRMETEELYRQDIEANYATASEYYDNYQQSSDKLIRFAFLQKVIDVMRINELLKAQYQIITVTGETIDSPIPLTDLEKERMLLLQNITVRLNVSGPHDAEMKSYLSAVVGTIGFKMVDDEADFDWNGRLNLTVADLNRDDMTGYSWNFTMEVKDNFHQFALKSFILKNRTMGVSEDQATVKMMNLIEKELNTKFYRQFMDYINNL